MTIEKPMLLTVLEAAQLLRIQRSKVYILISTGALKALKVGSDWRIRTDSLEALAGEIPAQTFSTLGKKSGMKRDVRIKDIQYLNGQCEAAA